MTPALPAWALVLPEHGLQASSLLASTGLSLLGPRPPSYFLSRCLGPLEVHMRNTKLGDLWL